MLKNFNFRKFPQTAFRQFARKYITDDLTLCLVGRPNVGKSALFNKMVGQGSAIVHPTPGLTRDFLIESIDDYKIPFNIIDTGGITFDKEVIKKAKDEKGAFFIPEILINTKEAIKRSHILIYVVDAKEGIKEEDREILKYLREHVIDLSQLEKEQVDEIKHLPVV